MKQDKSRILLRGEQFPGSKPPHGGSWLHDPETDMLTLLESPTAEPSARLGGDAKYQHPKLDPEKNRFLDLGHRPFLSNERYRDALSLWTKFSWFVSVDKGWREGCKSRLTGETEKWEAIICKGAGRLTEAEHETFTSLFTQAQRDPLGFLNLTGVSLGNIFSNVEWIKIQKTARDTIREMRLSKMTREDAAKTIGKAASYLDKVRPFVDSYLWWADHLPLVSERLKPRPPWEVPNRDQFPRGDWLRSIEWIIKNGEKVGLIPPGTNGKGGPPKDMLGYAAHDLQRVCESEMEASLKREQDGERRLSILIGRKVLLGPLTALLMASFPEWFKREVNPVRNVMNAIKRFRSGKSAEV